MATKSSITTSKVQAIVEKLGMSVKVKANSFKAFPKDGSIKTSLDITTNKHGKTAQVLLVGFTMTEGTILLAKPPASTATQVIDLSDEKLALRFIYKAAKHLIAGSKKVAAPSPTNTELQNDSPAATPVVEEAPVSQVA